MEKTSDFFDSWVKSQETFIENWTATAKKLQESFLGLGGPKGKDPDATGQGVFDLYNSWMTAVACALKDNSDSYLKIIKDTLSKTFSSSHAYTKLYEIWLPLAGAIQDMVSSAESYRKLIDPAKYKEIMDTIFGLTSARAISESYDQAVKLMQTLGTSASGFVGPWTDAAQKSMKTFPHVAEGRPEFFLNAFHTMFNAFDSTFGRAFHVPAVGKDREKVELFLKGLDDVSVYLAKNTEHQQMMYVTGLAAMEKVIETIAGKVRDGKEMKDFSEFFNLWIEVNEKAYYALFKTEAFSTLQGELLDSSLNVRKHFFKLMELYLYDFPIALRSEMDDLYKTMYELKKKVKGLEKELKKLSVQEAGA